MPKINEYERPERVKMDEDSYKAVILEMSNPIETESGYHIILIDERKEGKKLSKKELQKKAREILCQIKMEELLDSWWKASKIKRYLTF